MTSVLVKRGYLVTDNNEGKQYADTEKTAQWMEWHTHNPRNPNCQQTAAARRGRKDFPLEPQTSNLQNWKAINFCCFKSPSFWYFITAAQEPNTFIRLRFNFYLCMVSFSSLDFNLLKASYVYLPLPFTILWPPDAKSRLIRKDPDAEKDWRQKEKGAAREEMVR